MSPFRANRSSIAPITYDYLRTAAHERNKSRRGNLARCVRAESTSSRGRNGVLSLSAGLGREPSLPNNAMLLRGCSIASILTDTNPSRKSQRYIHNQAFRTSLTRAGPVSRRRMERQPCEPPVRTALVMRDTHETLRLDHHTMPQGPFRVSETELALGAGTFRDTYSPLAVQKCIVKLKRRLLTSFLLSCDHRIACVTSL